MQNKKPIDEIFHDIRNPLSFVTNNLSALAQYAKQVQKLLLHNKKLLGLIEKGGLSEPEDFEKLLCQLKRLYQEGDLDFVTDDLETLITESLEGCQEIDKQLHHLQVQWKASTS